MKKLAIGNAIFFMLVAALFLYAQQPVAQSGTWNVAVTQADGADTTLGAKADAKSTATDTTAITIMQVLKEISAMEQAPASRAVTNAGTFAVQLADGADTTLGAKADAKSTATDTTSITIMQVLKEISAMEQAPASRAVTNAGTFAVQAVESGTWTVQPGNTQNTTAWMVTPAADSASGEAASTCNILSAASTNSTSCKGSAGNFYGYEIFNTTTTVYYLRIYNASSAPTCSSATGFIRTIPIPPAAASGQVGGAVSNQAVPVNFGTGIGYCITGGSSSTDNTNAAAGVFGEIRYK